MAIDPETLKVYNEQAGDYLDLVEGAEKDPHLEAFIQTMRPGARVLDLGCGPGIAAAEMARAGLIVDAIDASAEMVTLASAHDGVNAWVATFDDIQGTCLYDGIWANFSLLHATRGAIPHHLLCLREAIKPGGLLHIGMKTGTGEKRDSLGRLYTYVSEDELSGLLRDANFTPHSIAHGRDKGLSGEISDWVVISAYA